jgi:hypothetical protein
LTVSLFDERFEPPDQANERAGKAAKSDKLIGQYVTGSDGKTYRVTMRSSEPDPWGRLDGDDRNEPIEIPRPWKRADEKSSRR